MEIEVVGRADAFNSAVFLQPALFLVAQGGDFVLPGDPTRRAQCGYQTLADEANQQLRVAKQIFLYAHRDHSFWDAER
ncbi:hypothetical protein D3C80_1965770 [compost metagenome]